MDLDNQGNILITGSFIGLGSFDPNGSAAGQISTVGTKDLYVAKYN